MASIFLSYSRENQVCAERIARVLERAGHQVWWDRHIASGREFAAEIESRLERSDLVLVTWSKSAAKSPWVRDEAAIGRDRGRLLPVLIDGGQPPIGFRQFQSLDLSGWKAREQDPRTLALIAAVDAVLSGSPAVPPPRTSRGWSALRGKRLWAAAAALALLFAAAAALFVFRTGREAEPTSLAVLPFKNLSSGDPYFAEGVAEEILNQLAREPQFKVAGRTSSALFKDAADMRDVGRRLHVAYVLEGSVRSAGNQVRVSVALIDTRRGRRQWSQDFRGTLDDIFAIQESIGQQVAVNLKRRLGRFAAVRGATTTRGDVYELYVTARSLIRTREPAKLATAVDLLQRAVKLDPNYAPAWARLAQATRMSRFYGNSDDPKSGWVRPDELGYASRALALAPDLAEAHAVMWLLSDAPNTSGAMKRRGRTAIEKAIQLDPTDSQTWYWLYIAREEELDFEGALAAARKAAEIDPFFVFNRFYTDLAWNMGERAEVERFLRNWAENHPEPHSREGALEGLALYGNDWSGAYQQLKKGRELAPAALRVRVERGMGLILRRLGFIEEAKRYLEPDLISMSLGEPPPPNAFSGDEPLAVWIDRPLPLYARLLTAHGRAAEITSVYDRAFPTPAAMIGRLDKPRFVEVAPIAAAALLDAKRADEARQLLMAANRFCAAAMRKGRTPVYFQVNCSRTWAMLGRGEDAIRTLGRALNAGWRPESGWGYAFVDEPVYRTIRNEPRLKRLGLFVLAENARERRELLAAGL